MLCYIYNMIHVKCIEARYSFLCFWYNDIRNDKTIKRNNHDSFRTMGKRGGRSTVSRLRSTKPTGYFKVNHAAAARRLKINYRKGKSVCVLLIQVLNILSYLKSVTIMPNITIILSNSVRVCWPNNTYRCPFPQKPNQIYAGFADLNHRFKSRFKSIDFF